jgi:3-oxosteroid 1-dehydrogenase
VLDRGVEARSGAAAKELVVVDGAVIGVRVQTADGDQLIGARRGVVLACGGFEWNEQMVAGFIGEQLMPLSLPYNEGDGHVMAMEAGAQLANMMSFWGQPALLEPGFEIDGRLVPQMASIRSMPGVMIVNRYGDRFINEGATYQDYPKALQTYDPVAVDYPNRPPTWVIFDQQVRDTAVVLPTVLPGQPTPDWIFTAPTIAELADQIGAPPERLEATVERWNANVEAGEDPDFHRGTFWWEAFMTGGPSPEACLRPVAKGPFYATQLINGTLGTHGGPRIDASGRVLGAKGDVIPGLYAAGNASACVYGRAYPGGGGTIGPAMTFGYLAGRAAAVETPRAV